ncbi:uncharacterized protein PHALS_08700 [Plasmopara halstedii]|uniref:Uncharacterized protein n=1 Tax=Plasmopara halstedii TaxID=4781 RepID=A0A0P1AE31_PLAHL|nr:uncharacterized protein PHALS_08700 [Plasmopara halstedii]CEG38639.1 hypothetical protein PHALS_08700 [Plasmopara halstedii]|eukprot:XP_024575008.1 hypothetical protein PHALS_08700 [Plasmopara halstedii]
MLAKTNMRNLASRGSVDDCQLVETKRRDVKYNNHMFGGLWIEKNLNPHASLELISRAGRRVGNELRI